MKSSYREDMNTVLGLDSRAKLVSWCMSLMFRILVNTLGIKLLRVYSPFDAHVQFLLT